MRRTQRTREELKADKLRRSKLGSISIPSTLEFARKVEERLAAMDTPDYEGVKSRQREESDVNERKLLDWYEQSERQRRDGPVESVNEDVGLHGERWRNQDPVIRIRHRKCGRAFANVFTDPPGDASQIPAGYKWPYIFKPVVVFTSLGNGSHRGDRLKFFSGKEAFYPEPFMLGRCHFCYRERERDDWLEAAVQGNWKEICEAFASRKDVRL